ncbi:hypothetical protein KM043_011965 [Ampulex compressa]|nr:hypothetical protein KM043_011965 [Ampulex compressa]
MRPLFNLIKQIELLSGARKCPEGRGFSPALGYEAGEILCKYSSVGNHVSDQLICLYSCALPRFQYLLNYQRAYKMLRASIRAMRNTVGGRAYANAPAQQHAVSASFKIQDTKDFDDRVKNSKVPVIVDFFATWCNPCRMLTPRIESVIAEKQGKILLAKVDIDENTDLALDYEVGSVPVLIAMKDGKVLERIVGLQDVDKLRTFVNKYAE